MKPYKGIVKIECAKGNKPCPQKVAGDSAFVICADCHLGEVRIIDLDGTELYKVPAPAEAVIAKKKTAKKKTKK